MVTLTIQTFYLENEGILQIIAIGVAIIVGYFTLFGPLFSYLRSQRKLRRDKRFETYHKLIEDVVGAHGTPMLDRQIAIVFELRRFSEYFPVTKRILVGLRKSWSRLPSTGATSNPEIPRLLNEIDITLKFIDANYFNRKYCLKKE